MFSGLVKYSLIEIPIDLAEEKPAGKKKGTRSASL